MNRYKLLTSIKLVIIGLLTSVTIIANADTKRPAAAQLCIACHNDKGEPLHSLWPNLAGQNVTYLINQIQAFKHEDRVNAIMGNSAKNLSEQQITAIADYFASLPWPVKRSTDTDKKNDIKNGHHSRGKNVSAYCISCHGIKGQPVNKEWPRIAGQNKAYIIKTLNDFKSGQRKSLPMKVIVDSLTAQQIEDVAAYYSQLP